MELKVKPPKLIDARLKPKDIIDRLKVLGYQTRITHHRYFGRKLLKNSDIRVLLKAMKIMGENDLTNIIMPRGGLTEVEIYKTLSSSLLIPLITAQSQCSLSDIFIYRKAARLALFRAICQVDDNESILTLRKEMQQMFLKYQIQIKDQGKWVDYDNPDFPQSEDKEIAENEAKQVASETQKEVRVVEVFE